MFVLYFDSGAFYLSRNFRLQRVGDARWLVDKFRFEKIGRYIDELVILNVSRGNAAGLASGNREVLSEAITYVMKRTFVPLTIGGGIKCAEDAVFAFSMGADKILLNTSLLRGPEFVERCVDKYGAQAIVGAIDMTCIGSTLQTKVCNGTEIGINLTEHVCVASKLGIGEILINSIDKDGTGMGFDERLLKAVGDWKIDVPLILCGGAGKPEHFSQALSIDGVEAVATGNLYNFIGSGFEKVKAHLLEAGVAVRKIVGDDDGK